MAIVAKKDLYYDDYSWKLNQENDILNAHAEPDNAPLNRREGYEMLDFINFFCDSNQLDGKDHAIKVERMVKEKVPATLSTRKSICEWVVKNWEYYYF